MRMHTNQYDLYDKLTFLLEFEIISLYSLQFFCLHYVGDPGVLQGTTVGPLSFKNLYLTSFLPAAEIGPFLSEMERCKSKLFSSGC